MPDSEKPRGLGAARRRGLADKLGIREPLPPGQIVRVQDETVMRQPTDLWPYFRMCMDVAGISYSVTERANDTVVIATMPNEDRWEFTVPKKIVETERVDPPSSDS